MKNKREGSHFKLYVKRHDVGSRKKFTVEEFLAPCILCGLMGNADVQPRQSYIERWHTHMLTVPKDF